MTKIHAAPDSQSLGNGHSTNAVLGSGDPRDRAAVGWKGFLNDVLDGLSGEDTREGPSIVNTGDTGGRDEAEHRPGGADRVSA